MFRYDPNNLDLLNDIKKQCQQESNLKQKENLKISFQKDFPLVNFDDLIELKLSRCPKNGCYGYYRDMRTNKFYGLYFGDHWENETNNYDWNKILQSGSFFNF